MSNKVIKTKLRSGTSTAWRDLVRILNHTRIVLILSVVAVLGAFRKLLVLITASLILRASSIFLLELGCLTDSGSPNSVKRVLQIN